MTRQGGHTMSHGDKMNHDICSKAKAKTFDKPRHLKASAALLVLLQTKSVFCVGSRQRPAACMQEAACLTLLVLDLGLYIVDGV